MNCKIESMNDNRRTNVDTLPPRGRVNEVRREWLVHEDEALAYRLQDEEIKQHLTGNKSRNLQIREDFPRAKDEQKREAEEAARLHQQFLMQQEQQDARVAAQLADIIEKEEEDRRRMLEEEDKELARLLQEKEKQRIERRERERRDLESHTPRKETSQASCDWKSQVPRKSSSQRDGGSRSYDADYTQSYEASRSGNNEMYYNENFSDMNNVGLPLQDIIQPFRTCSLGSYSSYGRRVTPSPPPMSEEEARRIQEEKDEELARYLQEKENLENIDTLNRDRLLAIETQDKELARLLQEKERAKARRARERAKEKAALKRMQEEGRSEPYLANDEQITIKTAETVQVNVHKNVSGEDMRGPTSVIKPPQLRHTSVKSKPRYPDPEEIVELEPEVTAAPVSNIAMTIDPTYSRESIERRSKSKKYPSKYVSDDVPERMSLPATGIF
ncbi:UNVERIFIED_CONTAM: hypothetical protein PYX00_004316 [Menopon gallinae]|uniref:Coiled-coil domain-containing protein n=1 Tax=Menopon gallinae TaxID=328185 RepID=A0AAW2I5U2_9NEOP